MAFPILNSQPLFTTHGSTLATLAEVLGAKREFASAATRRL